MLPARGSGSVPSIIDAISKTWNKHCASFLVTGGTSYSNLSFILERMFGLCQTVDPWKLHWLSRSLNLCYSSPLLGMNAYFQDIQSACHFLVSVSNQCDVIDIMGQSWSRSRSCPIGGRKTSFLPSNKCSQWKTLQLSQWKAVFTWTFTFLQWTFFLSFLFFFFLLMTSLFQKPVICISLEHQFVCQMRHCLIHESFSKPN